VARMRRAASSEQGEVAWRALDALHLDSYRVRLGGEPGDVEQLLAPLSADDRVWVLHVANGDYFGCMNEMMERRFGPRPDPGWLDHSDPLRVAPVAARAPTSRLTRAKPHGTGDRSPARLNER
jgi:hypothetical protein